MARLEDAERAWLEGRFSRLMEAALGNPPKELPADKIPNDKDIAEYNKRVAQYNANPVKPLITELQTQYNVKVSGIKPNGELEFSSGSVRDIAMFQKAFTSLRNEQMKSAADGADFDIRKIDGLNIPGLKNNLNLNVNDVPGMISNAGNIVDMFNPLKWISSIWTVVLSAAKQIPIVDDFMGALSEVMSSREFSMQNGKMRQAAERMFSYLDPKQRAIAVNNLMAEYAAEHQNPASPAGKPSPATGKKTSSISVPGQPVAFLNVPDGSHVTPSPIGTGPATSGYHRGA